MALLTKLRAGVRNNTELDLKISLAEWTWNETDGWEKAVIRLTGSQEKEQLK